ncbi:hypothetical protein [Edaphobacter acidisoli]|uniref:hypothetical protein n=1 Tax=Edaphobacter acidisoli TaxID=2040573 RepID=UPI0016698368|nr:hypothetical protein [Edaphobacter acidisoli]
MKSDPRWQAVQRVVHSKSFSRASRLSAFLLYICERAIEGHTDEITEQQIGVRVFGRPAHYNPGDDNIVRGTARLLRQRLELYYQEEGAADELRITVPRGTYVPLFERATEVQEQPDAERSPLLEDAPREAPLARHTFSRLWTAVSLLAAFALGAAALLAYQHFTRSRNHPSSPAAVLWRTVFPGDKRTLIIAGDAGVDMFDNLARQQVNINEYSERAYLSSPFAQTPDDYHWAPLATRAYVSVQDLKLATALVRLPEVRNDQRVFIHYAREIRPEDLMDANAVLIGSPAFNPWVQLFDKDQDFTMSYDGVENSITVIDHHPAAGEKSSYKWIWNDPEHAYALIALTNNLNGTGKVLLVESTTTMPTGAASDLLLNPGPMEQILARATNPNGSLKRFEVLLETSLVGNSSTQPKVIAVHIHNN